MIIKMFSAIYLSLAVIFSSVPLYWNHESWFHKSRRVVHKTAKNNYLSITISQQNWDLYELFSNFIKFYLYGSKVLYFLVGPGNGNLIHVDIIFAALRFVFLSQNFSANITLSLKIIQLLDLYYQRIPKYSYTLRSFYNHW